MQRVGKIESASIGFDGFAHLRFIFNRFYRGSHSDVRRFGGMGLRLFISAEIVRRHGGRTEVQSVVGEGSSFTVLLPMVS